MEKKQALESMVFEGYYHVPKNERLLVNREGRVIDLRLMACLITLDSDVANYNYPVVNVMGQGTLHIHRLVAETFIPVMGDTANLTVNHKDGIKINNSPDNLEWISRSGNLIHAYHNGLRSDGKAVLCKNARTGEVKRYRTIADCARHLNILVSVLRNFIKAKVPYLLDEVYEVVLEGDNWRGISMDNIIHVKPADPSVVCLKDNTYMVFDSAESAGRFLDVSETTIHRLIYSNNEFPYKDHRFFRRSEILDRLQDVNVVYVPGSFKDMKPSTKIKPVVVKDLVTGHITEWESATAFARVVGINRSTIQKAIGKNEGKWNQYQFSYKDKSPQSERIE